MCQNISSFKSAFIGSLFTVVNDVKLLNTITVEVTSFLTASLPGSLNAWKLTAFFPRKLTCCDGTSCLRHHLIELRCFQRNIVVAL